MNKYSLKNFEELVNLLVEVYGFEVELIHDNIVELLNGDTPLLRVLYDSSSGSIGLSLNVSIPGEQAIMIHSFIKERYKLISLAESYYEDNAGQTHLGQEADVAYEMDAEMDHRDSNVEAAPVSFISHYAIYEASHPQAAIDYQNFLNRKKIF